MSTQLDPVSVENLFSEVLAANTQDLLSESGDGGCDRMQLSINSRIISQYNLEQLKERLRGYTDSAMQTFQSCVTEHQVAQSGLMTQKVKLVKVTSQNPDDDLDDLKRMLKQEMAELSEIQNRIKPKLSHKLA